MRQAQFQNFYFEKFHPFWPLIHWHTFQNREQPPMLSQAVAIIGIWLSQAPEKQTLARDLYKKMIIQVSNNVVRIPCPLSKWGDEMSYNWQLISVS
jgi:hypothetical protein